MVIRLLSLDQDIYRKILPIWAIALEKFFLSLEILNMTVLNASLTFKKGNDIQHIILLPGKRVTFGRDNSNDIKLALFPLDDVVLQWATADNQPATFYDCQKGTMITSSAIWNRQTAPA